MGRKPYYESDNPGTVVRGVTWRLFAWILAAVLFAGLVSGGIWAFKVATSDIKGAGDQTRKVNDANNRINAQEHFHTLYNQVLAYDQQIDQAAKDKAEHPGDDWWATNYTGLVKTCIDARNQYNADTRKVTRAKWLDPALPYEITDTDPATDCKETE